MRPDYTTRGFDVRSEGPKVVAEVRLFQVGLNFLLRGYPWIASVLGVFGLLAALAVLPQVAGPTAGIVSMRLGCYVWLASVFSFAVGTGDICIANDRIARHSGHSRWLPRGVPQGKKLTRGRALRGGKDTHCNAHSVPIFESGNHA
jgi:hypothetical protein